MRAAAVLLRFFGFAIFMAGVAGAVLFLFALTA